MKPSDLYSMAHVFVSAIRVLDHKEGAPPSLSDLCELLGFSDEKGNYLLNRLKDLGIVDTVKSGFSNRIVIADHLAIENLPRDQEESRLEKELKKFKEGKDTMKDKVASIKAQQDQKKQELFADIQKKLKEKIKEK